ncbi:photoactive yellow protein [Marinospirillum perlucidum]|uniref:photoactive yellow protein n=1 Tax=Marinospirillum perlucidum TaxID=1982602 RepID=UPI000DF16FB5|nr:photoactive yellow protein [Marinospirillum perlucidum]
MELLSFDSSSLENVLSKMTAEELDELAFGAIQLDAEGTILQFNATEAAITGRQPEQVIGRNFFRDIAPCTDQPEFKGRFDEGVAQGRLNVIFEYTFDYVMRPTRVKIHMQKSAREASFWILVKRL